MQLISNDNLHCKYKIADTVILYCVLFSIFALAINLRVPKLFGEMSVELAFYPMLIANALMVLFHTKYIISLIYNRKNLMPLLLVALLLVSMLSFACNFSEISTASFRGRTGLEKSIVQFIVLGFGVTSFFTVSYLLSNYSNVIKKILSVNKYTLFVIALVGVLQICTIERLLDLSGIFPYTSHKRTNCLNYEASYLGVYFSFALPLFFYCYYKIKTRLNFFVMLITAFLLYLISYYSFSRTLYVIVLIINILLLLVCCFQGQYIKRTLLLLSVFILACNAGYSMRNFSTNTITSILPNLNQFLFPSVEEECAAQNKRNPYTGSNITRFGCWRIACNMGLRNPISGVGLGQYGFNLKGNVDDEALKSPEIKGWIDNGEGKDWIPTHNLHLRVFAELGGVGLLLWATIWAYSSIKLFFIFIRQRSLLTAIVLILNITTVLAGFNLDTFRMHSIWFTLAMSYFIINTDVNAKKEEYENSVCM